MIGSLKGKLDYQTASYLVLDIGGVGYKVYVPGSLIANKKPEQILHLFTYTHVKDDALDLYGFSKLEELQLFELLISVSGIGPKTALHIFSLGGSERISRAIADGDVDFFTAAPRLGRKNAQKLIIELRSKIGALGDLDLSESSGETKEILDALKTFGFGREESRRALQEIKEIEGDTAVKVRAALKYLGK